MESKSEKKQSGHNWREHELQNFIWSKKDSVSHSEQRKKSESEKTSTKISKSSWLSSSVVIGVKTDMILKSNPSLRSPRRRN